MGEKTGIAWTDSTFNPWIGCTKVSPGCDHCYAEALDERHRWKGATHWGAGVPRLRTAASNWAKPLTWNRAREKDGKRHLVFCASLADVFDNEVPPEWRADLFKLIKHTRALTWLLLTKRIGNAVKMLPEDWDDAPYGNVWMGASVVNQQEADRDIPKLLDTPAAKRFVSYEPAVGPIDFAAWLYPDRVRASSAGLHEVHGQPIIDWIIVGGESSQGVSPGRPFDHQWARTTIAQCRLAGIAPFVKQLGRVQIFAGRTRDCIMGADRAGADMAQWPDDLRVQEFPQ